MVRLKFGGGGVVLGRDWFRASVEGGSVSGGRAAHGRSSREEKKRSVRACCMIAVSFFSCRRIGTKGMFIADILFGGGGNEIQAISRL